VSLFEHRNIRKYFEDWQDDNFLVARLANGARGRGKTPLGKSQWLSKARSTDREG